MDRPMPTLAEWRGNEKAFLARCVSDGGYRVFYETLSPCVLPGSSC